MTFSRGNFDFITIPIEELFPVNEEQPYTVDYESIFRMLEDNFGAKCKLYGEAELSCDDVSRMIVEARNRSVYPLVICAVPTVIGFGEIRIHAEETSPEIKGDEIGYRAFRVCISFI